LVVTINIPHCEHPLTLVIIAAEKASPRRTRGRT
jgi:hypothetical protein